MSSPTRKFRIADRLSQARRAFLPALSQSGLAQRACELGLKECKSSRISRLEAGYADAEWSEVEALAKVLNVTAQWLARTGEPSAPVPPAPPAQPVPSPVPAVVVPAVIPGYRYASNIRLFGAILVAELHRKGDEESLFPRLHLHLLVDRRLR